MMRLNGLFFTQNRFQFYVPQPSDVRRPESSDVRFPNVKSEVTPESGSPNISGFITKITEAGNSFFINDGTLYLRSTFNQSTVIFPGYVFKLPYCLELKGSLELACRSRTVQLHRKFKFDTFLLVFDVVYFNCRGRTISNSSIFSKVGYSTRSVVLNA